MLIAGLGAIGQRHARNLRALDPGVELLALRRRRLAHVVTESLRRDDSRDVERELDATVFTDLDQALAARPDAVFVCTPSSQHLEIAQRAAEAGCHLFIEKPLSNTLDGVERLRAAATAAPLVVLVGCQWRYHPAVRWLRTMLQDGALGRLSEAAIEYAEYLPDWHPYEDYRASYAARADLGGGVVLTQIHDYDLAWWLFGPPRRVSASGGHLSELDIDVEDTVEAVLHTAELDVTVRQSMAARPPRRTIAVAGEHGSIAVDLLTGNVRSRGAVAPAPGFADYQRNRMFIDEAAHFLACIAGTARPAVPLDEGIAVLQVALAVRRAIGSGRTEEMS